ncbi:helix-turn-helix domain-containing protein [Paramicrobacterium chengjingii]|uniref:Helix-turn-helix domain-containing protein n=1 Tax=Paramicrobacterium chengjingii TaxID=2769067 RepID=A0ABX6YI06_9MICO|nr:helix-turn-helix domain-containing protein [Microbacterium chengjingii]QPZ38397.1 helix-turn-helix domain-containing protein [Microbacterium chengjingii]
MTPKPVSGLVELRDITGSPELSGLRELYLANPSSPVRALALISDIEELISVGPDTVALLTPDVARGGWMISAALRYAWERRACAIIVPEQSFTQTVIDLARRLEVSLLTTNHDMRALAIDAAVQMGVARAGSLARVNRFTQRIAQARDLRSALALTSDELDGVDALIETAGAVTLRSSSSEVKPTATRSHADRAEMDAGYERVAVPITSVDSEFDALVAYVPESAASLAEQILAAATPSVRALLADARLKSTRDSLPVITITALSGDARGSGVDDPSREALFDEFDWLVGGAYSAVFIMSDLPEQTGTAVHQLWNAVVPTVPLARLIDGWIGFVPESAGRTRGQLLQRMRQHMERLRKLEVRVGISAEHSSPQQALRSVREAWLAARTADPLDTSGAALVEFEQLSARLLPQLLPYRLAEQIGELVIPDLLADPAADELMRAVVVYLSHHGSASAAAEQLGVHRNTLQTRLKRAEKLGVPLSHPENVLPMHMLLSGLLRGR